ncbi:hypothetical protein GKZ75_08395 [Kocuria indica]|uniref:Glutaredoxin domain-containing protein n=1 Tax=Kocuria marina subsp. indica TaxID=1049583 RepID=A0A6N9R0R7_9MICC|nr:glutaredoxin family protein [Kocuria indica]NDO78241.1 hypothetical protein [Kocuria indica]
MQQAAVTVYSKPVCVACERTKHRLKRAGVEFTEVDITQDETAYRFVTRDLGYTAAPVVYVSDGDTAEHWSGYRPGHITTHITSKEN